MNRLEARYRRLLRLYPREHRARYQAEMLAVLLEVSRPGQQHPGLRNGADLIRGALVAWAVQASQRHRGEWTGAWAIIACLAPLTLSVFGGLFAAGFLIRAWADGGTSWVGQLMVGVAALVWPVIALLAWTGRRTLARATAWAAVVVAFPALLGQHQEWLVFALLAALGITVSAGPAEGAAQLGRLRMTGYGLGVLLWGVFFVYGLADNLWPGWAVVPAWLGFSLGTALIVSAAFSGESGARRRAVLLLAAPLAAVGLSLSRVGASALGWSPAYWVETSLAAALPAALFLALLLAYVRGRRSDATGAG